MNSSKDSSGKIRLFVYGTLKKGKQNHRLLEAAGATFLGFDSITGPYQFVEVMGIPCLLHREPGTTPDRTIYGEVWAGDDELLTAADIIEANTIIYQRIKARSDIQNFRVWIYFLTPVFWNEIKRETVIKTPITEESWQQTEEEKTFWVGHNAAA